jgi:hypothetical protein
MEGGKGKKLNFTCHQIAVVQDTLLDEDDEAQTHRHSPTIHCMWLPTIYNTCYVDASRMEIYTSHVVVLIGTGIIMCSY